MLHRNILRDNGHGSLSVQLITLAKSAGSSDTSAVHLGCDQNKVTQHLERNPG